MRIWDIPPDKLCRKHLLGEHSELHAIWTILTQGRKGYSRHPETVRWKGKLKALYDRHQALVHEMTQRGYKHHSPLSRRLATGAERQDVFIDAYEDQCKILRDKGCGCMQQWQEKTMTDINKNSIATLEFQLTWTSDIGKHTEIYHADHVNFWRDVFPQDVYEALMGSKQGDRLHFSLPPGEFTRSNDPGQVFTIDDRQFERPKINGHQIGPQLGRFYPKGFLKGLAGIHNGNIEPFRCVDIEPPKLTADFNHPLSGRAVELEVIVRDVTRKVTDRGGRLTDWTETITEGPGMQVRCNGSPTDFFSDSPFVRSDEEGDSVFYEQPRLVTHIDSRAIETISNLYGDILKPGMRVLDLMSSWRSHVPESLALESLVGLGLNSEEMENNPQLTSHVVHDLNMDPRLPFDDQSFDAVICTVSVEYMIHPFNVFIDLARVLKPGGFLVHTFSNRWFPPKAIRIWAELCEFERMGLVLEYFLGSGAYKNLKTYSARGWPRPETDRHYPEILTADPVYAVWGSTIED